MTVANLREAIKNPPLEWPGQGIRQPKGMRQQKRIYLTFARDAVLAFLTARLPSSFTGEDGRMGYYTERKMWESSR